MSGLPGWETVGRVGDDGSSESRQRILAPRRVVDASEAGARWLGVCYWQAVRHATRGAVHARWRAEGGSLRLLGAATLLTFGPPELACGDGAATCRYSIRGGLLAVGPGGSVTLEQHPQEDGVEISVTVAEYLPRLAARVGAPRWTGLLYANAQSPFHVGVSRRYFQQLLRGTAA